jgi:hypothetical protein
MTSADTWWQSRWVRGIESILGHALAIIVGFVMMVVGLGLGVTMIMLPVGVVVGLLGAAILVAGLFARPGRSGG